MEYKEIIELTSYWSVIVAAVVTVLLASLAYGQWRKEYIGKKSINFGLELLQQVLRARYVFKWCLTGIVYADEYSDRPIGSEQEEETVGDRQIRDRAWAIVKG